MADSTLNGEPGAALDGDVEMKEEVSTETPLETLPSQASDPTDPLPPPESQPQTAIIPEHLSTITPSAPPPPPAAATPPVTSTAPPPRPSSIPPPKSSMPERPVAHGGPTRRYLNENVTPHLLEAMKYLAAAEPEKPLMWLSDFLRTRSGEVEG